MDNIINSLYELSEKIHGLMNGYGPVDSLNDSIVFNGKIYSNQDGFEKILNIKNESFVLRDCRSNDVDYKIKVIVKDKINKYISDFCKNNECDDSLLFIGFSINLYYIVGLYQIFGKFNINDICVIKDDDSFTSYVKLINDYLYARFIKRVKDNIAYLEIKNKALFKESYECIINNKSEDRYTDLIDSVSDCHKNYIPELFRFLLEYNDEVFDANSILNLMVKQYPQYSFGLIYNCFNDTCAFFEKKNKESTIYQWSEVLDSEIFLHIIGVRRIDHGKFEFNNGEINVLRPVPFTNMGIGIPTVKPISKEYHWNNVVLNENNEYCISNDDLRAQTAQSLGVDYYIPVDDNPLEYMGDLFNKILLSEKEIKAKNVELEKLHAQKKKMVNHLAHSWGNECYPEIVKKVAEELLKSGDSSLANRLFKAYNSENNLMGEIVFLQAAMDDSPEKLRDIFCDSFYISGNGDRNMKIEGILNEALDLLVFGLLNDSQLKDKRKKCCNKLASKYSIKQLADDYSKRFVDCESDKPFATWFSENVFPLKVYIDDTWKSINFGQTEYGKIIMKNIFSELFTNVLLHGKEYCEIDLISSDEELIIEMSNVIDEGYEGSKKGLESLKELVYGINYGTSIPEEKIMTYRKTEDNEFIINVRFDKELMIIDED